MTLQDVRVIRFDGRTGRIICYVCFGLMAIAAFVLGFWIPASFLIALFGILFLVLAIRLCADYEWRIGEDGVEEYRNERLVLRVRWDEIQMVVFENEDFAPPEKEQMFGCSIRIRTAKKKGMTIQRATQAAAKALWEYWQAARPDAAEHNPRAVAGEIRRRARLQLVEILVFLPLITIAACLLNKERDMTGTVVMCVLVVILGLFVVRSEFRKAGRMERRSGWSEKDGETADSR